jgi:hypothetical protein
VREPNTTHAHSSIVNLQKEMLADSRFKDLCESHGLPWAPEEGFEPRGYNGPDPAEVRVLYVSAEPGPITEEEKLDLLPAVTQHSWMEFDTRQSQHYWRENLFSLCQSIWPEDTAENMDKYLAGAQAFWMSPPSGDATAKISRELEDYFSEKYFYRLLDMMPNAVVLAAGGKAQERLKRMGVDYVKCASFMRPGCNADKNKATWPIAGLMIRESLTN